MGWMVLPCAADRVKYWPVVGKGVGEGLLQLVARLVAFFRDSVQDWCGRGSEGLHLAYLLLAKEN